MRTESWLSLGALAVALISMLVVSRNARRATAVQAEKVDLDRIRDLRSELKEAKSEVDSLQAQLQELNRKLIEANRRGMEANNDAIAAYRERAEMIRYARMPGITIDDWLARFDPHEIER